MECLRFDIGLVCKQCGACRCAPLDGYNYNYHCCTFTVAEASQQHVKELPTLAPCPEQFCFIFIFVDGWLATLAAFSGSSRANKWYKLSPISKTCSHEWPPTTFSHDPIRSSQAPSSGQAIMPRMMFKPIPPRISYHPRAWWTQLLKQAQSPQALARRRANSLRDSMHRSISSTVMLLILLNVDLTLAKSGACSGCQGQLCVGYLKILTGKLPGSWLRNMAQLLRVATVPMSRPSCQGTFPARKAKQQCY